MGESLYLKYIVVFIMPYPDVSLSEIFMYDIHVWKYKYNE